MDTLHLGATFEGLKTRIDGAVRITFDVSEDESEKVLNLLSLRGKYLILTITEDTHGV